MNGKFLYNLQRDILEKKGMYILYAFVCVISFVITMENIKIFCNVFRLILVGIALIFLVGIYFRCKDSRDERENKIIIYNIVFFFVMTCACVYMFLKG